MLHRSGVGILKSRRRGRGHLVCVARFGGGAPEKFAAIWRAFAGGALAFKLIPSVVAGEGREADGDPRPWTSGSEQQGS
jgi:hypothetical protein